MIQPVGLPGFDSAVRAAELQHQLAPAGSKLNASPSNGSRPAPVSNNNFGGRDFRGPNDEPSNRFSHH
jgi:hypothetical protein